MNYNSIVSFLSQNDSIKLLKADNAPLIISFLYKAFKQGEKIEIKETDIVSDLDFYLRSLNMDEPKRFPRESKEYLTEWTNSGFLKKDYYGKSDDSFYELTPPTENVLKWIEDLQKPKFVGTDSRLKDLFEKMKELSTKTKEDSSFRIQELELEKQRIETEIENIKNGKVEIFDERQVKEKYVMIEETARHLLYDFRQVEQNFRDLDRNFREKVIQSNLTKGENLKELFEKQDHLKGTDQGKSFQAFWEFLLFQSKQEEFESVLDEIMNIPIVQKIKSESFPMENIKSNLIAAGDKVNKTRGNLISQLRIYLEQTNLLENKRIYENIQEIKRVLLNCSQLDKKDFPKLEVDDTIKIDLIFERPLFKPVQDQKIKQVDYEIGQSSLESNALFELFEINMDILRQNIKDCLKKESQISFFDFLKKYPIKKGIAEVIGYLEIVKMENHYSDPNSPEEIIINNVHTDKQFRVKIPRIILYGKK